LLRVLFFDKKPKSSKCHVGSSWETSQFGHVVVVHHVEFRNWYMPANRRVALEQAATYERMRFQSLSLHIRELGLPQEGPDACAAVAEHACVRYKDDAQSTRTRVLADAHPVFALHKGRPPM
jgi:hypothetical protein